MNKWFGTVYRFHPLFVLMMLCSIFIGYFIELLTLFTIVFIHELGHVSVAKGFGWRVKEVQLLPFGGVAVVEESGNIPAFEEIWVALAGPLQNAWMAVFAYAMKQFGFGDDVWWDYFMQANILIGLFNLLPIQPLDGGRILAAILSLRFCYYRTLRYCAWLSLAMSAVLVIGALLQFWTHGRIQLNLLVIGLFLIYSNWFSYRHIPYQFRRFLMSRENRAIKHLTQGTIAKPIVVASRKEIKAVVQLFMREQYHLIFVLNERGIIQKVLTEQRMIQSYLSEEKSNRAVSEVFM